MVSARNYLPVSVPGLYWLCQESLHNIAKKSIPLTSYKQKYLKHYTCGSYLTGCYLNSRLDASLLLPDKRKDKSMIRLHNLYAQLPSLQALLSRDKTKAKYKHSLFIVELLSIAIGRRRTCQNGLLLMAFMVQSVLYLEESCFRLFQHRHSSRVPCHRPRLCLRLNGLHLAPERSIDCKHQLHICRRQELSLHLRIFEPCFL